jgi:hypothetical protein
MAESYSLNDLKFIGENKDSDLKVFTYANPKLIIVEYLKNIFSNIKLNDSIIISTSFPTENFFSAFRQNSDNANLMFKYKRGVNVLLNNQSLQKYLGNVLRGDKYGYLENFNISVLTWSFDPIDRDILGDLLVRVLFLAQETQYFLKRGLTDFYIDSYNDNQDEKLIINHALFYRDIKVVGKRLIFATKPAEGSNIPLIQDVITTEYMLQIDVEI